MAVFRVERTRDYTVMCNHHLKDSNLSLKAKGLLSMMLSLPDEWNYTTRGLAAICKEGVDAIGKTLKELELAGYIIRRQLRGKDGRIPGAEVLFPSGREVVGKCPRCGAEVTESQKGFFCENRSCAFVLWKNSRFFAAKKKALTKSLAAALLKNGRAPLKGCYSEKTGKTYDAVVLLEDDGQHTGYKLVFDKRRPS